MPNPIYHGMGCVTKCHCMGPVVAEGCMCYSCYEGVAGWDVACLPLVPLVILRRPPRSRSLALCALMAPQEQKQSEYGRCIGECPMVCYPALCSPPPTIPTLAG